MPDDRAVLLHAMQQIGENVPIDLVDLAAKLGWRERRMRLVAKKLAAASLITLTNGLGRASLTQSGANF